MSDYLIDNLDLTGVRNVLNENRPMKIDVRSAESVFITIKGITYYIDDSTGEQIVEVYKEESKLLKTAQPIKD
tara:strand:+ start:306 stop:524 length:219 start_codon:yes stop_codon:yes gene_type:complete